MLSPELTRGACAGPVPRRPPVASATAPATAAASGHRQRMASIRQAQRSVCLQPSCARTGRAFMPSLREPVCPGRSSISTASNGAAMASVTALLTATNAPVEQEALMPLPLDVEGAADDPSLHNPLERQARLGTGWFGVVVEYDGVLFQDSAEQHKEVSSTGLNGRAWLEGGCVVLWRICMVPRSRLRGAHAAPWRPLAGMDEACR